MDIYFYVEVFLKLFVYLACPVFVFSVMIWIMVLGIEDMRERFKFPKEKEKKEKLKESLKKRR